MIKERKKVKVIDLFCGIGGLTHGLVKAGLPVTAGFDIDGNCKFGYEYNNHAKFYEQDIKTLKAKQLNKIYGDADVRILVGCAPCQPYSSMNVKRDTYSGEEIREKSPLDKFANLIDEIKPEIVSMENVPGLITDKKSNSFKYFLDILKKNNYSVDYKIIDCVKYGIPQKRRRLVLLASRIGKISLIKETHKKEKTVRETIGDLPKIKCGEVCKTDRYHVGQNLTQKNLDRLKVIPHNGGDLLDVNEKYWPKCYKKKSGRHYLKNIYGRMFWDKAAPTMTTMCTGIGNGRFSHPEQDRAISVREAARFQTFPDDYQFFPEGENCNVMLASKFIGNAVPVRLGEVIGESIKNVL